MAVLDFKMPDVGEGLSEAEIVEWMVAVGDSVDEDQPVVVVQTDKAVVDIPSPAGGTIVALGAQAGETILIGATLVGIEVGDAVADTPAPASNGSSDPAAGRPKASPATRKRAGDLGVDLRSVPGTGPGGRISPTDLDAASPGARPDEASGAAGQPAVPIAAAQPSRAAVAMVPVPQGADRVEPLRGIRRQIAKTMTQSWQTIPHMTELRELDATELVRAHRRLRAHLQPAEVRLTFLPLFVKAVTATLHHHPNFNASLDLEAEQITYHHRCNIGIATSSEDGLTVPVIHDADQRSLLDLAVEIDALATAVRNRSTTREQLSDGTFTISNYGSYGTWMGTPIIRPPEVAIAGFGRIRDAVVAVEGQPVVRQVLPIAVSADHRLNDGDHLGAFMNTLSQLLEDPILLVAEAAP